MNDKCLMIKCENNFDEYKCNICSDKINEGEIVALKCNVQKHIFCYDCISDWFDESMNNKIYKYQIIKNMCPICRKNGGKIPYLDKKKESKMNKNIYYDIKDGININCGHYIKKTNKICYNVGKKEYNYKCGKHKDKNLCKPCNKDEVNNEILNIKY